MSIAFNLALMVNKIVVASESCGVGHHAIHTLGGSFEGINTPLGRLPVIEYPNIDGRTLTPLHIVRAEMAQNPGYLDHDACPYTVEIKEFLRVFGGNTTKTVEKGVFSGENGDKWSVLEAEAANLYQELKNFSGNIKDAEVAERMSYFRTATALVEKIVSINERAVGLKHINDFQQAILAIFDTELTGDQRTRIIQRLRHMIDGESQSHE